MLRASHMSPEEPPGRPYTIEPSDRFLQTQVSNGKILPAALIVQTVEIDHGWVSPPWPTPKMSRLRSLAHLSVPGIIADSDSTVARIITYTNPTVPWIIVYTNATVSPIR